MIATSSRRIATLTVTVVLLIVLVIIGAFVKVPYVALGPGPTLNTLGEYNGKPVVAISGIATTPTDGHLNMTTVSVSSDLTLFQALGAWFSGDQSLTPREEVFPPDRTQQQVDQENRAEMGGSQDSATVAALGYLHRTHLVVEVDPKGPAAGTVDSGDQITAVNGTPVSTPAQLRSAVSGLAPGTQVSFDLVRGGAPMTVSVRLGARPDDASRGYLGVTPRLEPDDPNIKIGYNVGNIGGPSAGLMLTLAIIDKLEPQSLTGGRFIAGTGTIDDSGDVGEIGGITHKTVAARRAGAQYFLTPSGNCAEARSDKPSGLTLVKVDTLDDAMGALEDIRTNRPTPHC
ncbi:PDZ domain-containing protein [Gordonia jinhuaensis]|uniref:endopeptidase La n=1 Tax=Gordonia jinhuaensis TaxID=1517702 RepID=A0A916TH40_9ACTN|nr:PDZ domain-containing protein [Gordonia jinhuaensis]GGB45292.1 hypothetical protein GCM10011489_35920 [Gordonia jinhuaensis]